MGNGVIFRFKSQLENHKHLLISIFEDEHMYVGNLRSEK